MLTKSVAFLLLVVVCFSAADEKIAVREHSCDPGSEVFVCSVPEFYYVPGTPHSTLLKPNTSRTVRLGYPKVKRMSFRVHITAYDEILHEVLHRPRAVEIKRGQMRSVQIPHDLEYVDFTDHYIDSIYAAQDGEGVPALRYLDISDNRLEALTNLSVFVNLEILFASFNSLHNVVELKHLVKLTGLKMHHNNLVELPNELPTALEFMDISSNRLSEVSFAGHSFPALELLNLRDNLLEKLDFGPMNETFPVLSKVFLTENRFSESNAEILIALLKEAGVVHDKIVFEPDYYEQEEQNYYTELQKHNLRESIFCYLLGFGNMCIMVWGAFRLYKAKGRPT